MLPLLVIPMIGAVSVAPEPKFISPGLTVPELFKPAELTVALVELETVPFIAIAPEFVILRGPSPDNVPLITRVVGGNWVCVTISPPPEEFVNCCLPSITTCLFVLLSVIATDIGAVKPFMFAAH